MSTFVEDFNNIDKNLKLADKEIYLMIGLIYQGKKYACAVRHNNADESLSKVDKFCDEIAFIIRHTIKRKGWVKEEIT